MKTELTKQEMEIARRLVDRVPARLIAEEFRMSTKTVFRMAKRPEILVYMDKLRGNLAAVFTAKVEEKVEEEAAKVELAVAQMAIPTIGEVQVAARLWELANIDPKVTGGSMTGQRECLADLRVMLRLDRPAASPTGESDDAPEKPDVYRAAWMQKPN